MQRAKDGFDANIKYVRELMTLYEYLKTTLPLADVSILLRTQWMYSVSALDKLIHDLVRIGMIESFLGLRPKTSKFNAYQLSFSTMQLITNNVGTPPPEYWLEREIVLKHKKDSYQDPDKITEALSLMWLEEHKWQKISIEMNLDERYIKTKLKNIVQRRNQIVHEADMDISTGNLFPIDVVITNDAIDFIESLGKAILKLVA